jgi:hypothetical protein
LGIFITESETNQSATPYFDCDFWFLSQKEEFRSRGVENGVLRVNTGTSNGGSDKRLENVS